MSKGSFLPNNYFRNVTEFQRYLTPALLLGMILLLGTALRFYDLGVESYWIDEMSTIIEAQQSIPQMITSGRLDQPPAYYIPFHIWVKIFGATEVSSRSFSALAGIGSIILIYLIGQELFGKSVGLLSAFLMAISEFQIIFSQEARFYSLFEFMILLSFLFLILALKSKRPTYFVLYGVASILMVYSHTFGVFIIAAQNLFLILLIKKYKNILTIWVLCQALVVLAILPSFYLLIFGGSGISGTIASNMAGNPLPSLLEPLHTAYRFIMPLRRELSWSVFLANYALVGILIVVSAFFGVVRQGKRLIPSARNSFTNLQVVPDLRDKLLLMICWFVCPILLPFFLSMQMGNFYADRYTIGAAPALYLMIALFIYYARKLVPIIISLVALAALIAPSLSQYYLNDVNEQWREAGTFVEKYSLIDDVIVFAPEGTKEIYIRSFNWYYRGSLPTCGLKGKPDNPNLISEALMQCISGHSRFWVIMDDSIGTVDPYESFSSIQIR